MDEPPITSIVRHRRERRQKCSLTPLRDRPGFRFYNYPGPTPEFADHLRLVVSGSLLTPADRARPILLIDGSWRHARAMNDRFAHVEGRGLPALVTAYPRVSKLYPDPAEGLASIEAMIAAYFLLGRDIAPLVAAYPRGREFLASNADFFGETR